jgi:hypothetical protein
MTKDAATQQLFDAVTALIDALYWPGSDTAYVHSETYVPLALAYQACAEAYGWEVPPRTAADLAAILPVLMARLADEQGPHDGT